MNDATPAILDDTSAKLIRHLAREVAIDLYPIETILERSNITPALWDAISTTSYFKKTLDEEVRVWGSTQKTHDRVRMKYLVMVEEAAPELYKEMTNSALPLSARVELLKTVSRIANVDAQAVDSSSGARVSITINMGDAKLDVPSVQIPANVIEHDAAG